MGQVYPWVGLDCVELGQKFSTFNESGWDGSNCKKCVKGLKYINITSIAYLHCLLRFFVGSGFVGPRTRGLHGMDWFCLILGWVIRYDTRCYFNVRSKADISQLNLPHGTDN